LAAGDGAKTVYAKYRDRAGNVSDVYSDSIILDTTLPTGSLIINDQATYVTTTLVTLDLTASDANGVTQMRFSNDGTNYGAWVAYATVYDWTLVSGDGLKTVHVEFKDGASNISAPATDDIVLDTTDPTGTINIEGGAEYVAATQVTLDLTASDANEVAQMRFSNDGSNYSSWESYSTTRPWVLPQGDGSKTVYVEFMDNAGLVCAPLADTITLDTIAPTGSILIAGGAEVVTGTEVILTLTASDANGVTNMRMRNNAEAWSAWEPFTTVRTWTLPAEEGEHTVWVQFRDVIANVSVAYSDTVVYQLPYYYNYLPLVIRHR
jgi:hypothetical protein